MDVARVTTVGGQTICAQVNAELFTVWLDDAPDRPVSATREFLAGAVAEAMGFDVAHDDLPGWIDRLTELIAAEFPER